MTNHSVSAVTREHHDHPRRFEDNHYIYPVLSRRSGGISIGVNLNPDKRCNFDCIYCQVDRHSMPPRMEVDLAHLAAELRDMLRAAGDGRLFEHARFRDLPPEARVVRDVAISGDGEPTLLPNFAEAVETVLKVMREVACVAPLILITNATTLDRPAVLAGVRRLLDVGGGDVWAKLDAGSQAYFEKVDATQLSLDRIVAGITQLARQHPITVQSCFMRIGGATPDDAEIGAYAARLGGIVKDGGTLRAVQLYTVSRAPAQPFVTPLTEGELVHIREIVLRQVPGLAVEVYR